VGKLQLPVPLIPSGRREIPIAGVLFNHGHDPKGEERLDLIRLRAEFRKGTRDDLWRKHERRSQKKVDLT